MKFTFIVLALASAGVFAQSKTNCTRDYWGNFSCQTQPDGGSFIDFGAFQRGADEANQRAQQSEIMQRQLQMQQQMLEQQQQLRLQQEILNQGNDVPEWQRVGLILREDGKATDGNTKCVFKPKQGLLFVNGKRYKTFYTVIAPAEQCPDYVLVSKFTGESK
jgi:hypothetical protein